MTMRSRPHVTVAAALAVVCAACGSSGSATTRPGALPLGSQRVHLDPANFVATVDHPHWPLRPGAKWTYRDSDGHTTVATSVTHQTKVILGVRATVVHDVAVENGDVVEDTFDWYAQDKAGNLWYLGEDTKTLKHGAVTSRSGSWEAGVKGAQPGVILPAAPAVGTRYRQEYLKGEAEDTAEIETTDGHAQIPYGSFDHLVVVKDTSPLEPRVVEHKYYARGVGLVLTIEGGGREELVGYTPGG